MFRRHCSDEELLESLDGELGTWARFRVSRHLSRCWKCRSARAALDSQINEIARIVARDQVPAEMIQAARERFFRSAAQLPLMFREGERRRFALERWPVKVAAGLVVSLSAFAYWHYAREIRPVAVRPVPPPKQAAVKAAPAALPTPELPHPVPAVVHHRPEPPIETGSDLDAIEMQVLHILHRRHACLGEEVEVARTGSGELSVRGVVVTRDRKRELAEALEAAPLAGAVQLDLRALDEIPDSRYEAAPPRPGAPETEAASSAIPIEPALIQYFQSEDPGRGARENHERAANLSNKALRLAGLALSHAWALRHFAERYPPERLSRLHSPESALAGELIRDHLSSLASASAELNALVRVPLHAAAGDAPGEAPAADLFAATERLFTLTNDLFACGDAPLKDLPARAAALERTLEGMAAAVSSAAPSPALYADGRR